MTWNYRIGKKGDCYYIYEYIHGDDGDGWTQDPIVTNCYQSKEDAVEDIKMMLDDIRDDSVFDYE